MTPEQNRELYARTRIMRREYGLLMALQRQLEGQPEDYGFADELDGITTGLGEKLRDLAEMSQRKTDALSNSN